MVERLGKYPHQSNPRKWEREEKFIKQKESLLPYYMAPKTKSFDFEHLFSTMMAGIDNSKDWLAAAGVEISREDFFLSDFNIRQVRTFFAGCFV